VRSTFPDDELVLRSNPYVLLRDGLGPVFDAPALLISIPGAASRRTRLGAWMRASTFAGQRDALQPVFAARETLGQGRPAGVVEYK
jgi:hypothetical protein